jgi:hypothetical protein
MTSNVFKKKMSGSKIYSQIQFNTFCRERKVRVKAIILYKARYEIRSFVSQQVREQVKDKVMEFIRVSIERTDLPN